MVCLPQIYIECFSVFCLAVICRFEKKRKKLPGGVFRIFLCEVGAE